jgi:ribonucleotide monophosphatase NagD (HAD superfamily)
MIPTNIKALILDMDGVIWKGNAPDRRPARNLQPNPRAGVEVCLCHK